MYLIVSLFCIFSSIFSMRTAHSTSRRWHSIALTKTFTCYIFKRCFLSKETYIFLRKQGQKYMQVPEVSPSLRCPMVKPWDLNQRAFNHRHGGLNHWAAHKRKETAEGRMCSWDNFQGQAVFIVFSVSISIDKQCHLFEEPQHTGKVHRCNSIYNLLIKLSLCVEMRK